MMHPQANEGQGGKAIVTLSLIYTHTSSYLGKLLAAMSGQRSHRERCMQATTVPDRCCLVNLPTRPARRLDVDSHSCQVGGVT